MIVGLAMAVEDVDVAAAIPGVMVGSDNGDDGLLQKHFIDDEVFYLIIFAWTPLRPLFPHCISVFSLFWGAVVLHETSFGFINEVVYRAKPWSVAFLLELSISAYCVGWLLVKPQ